MRFMIKDFQVKGICPVCGKRMNVYKTIYWKGAMPNALDFPYEIYHCDYHGAYIWRSRKNQLADFSKIQREATILPLSPELKERIKWVDYEIVEIQCPYCKEKWKQHKDFPPESWRGVVICPNGHQISKDKAVQK